MDMYHDQTTLRRKSHQSSNIMSFELSVYEAVFGAVIEIQKQHLSELEIRIKNVSNMSRSTKRRGDIWMH